MTDKQILDTLEEYGDVISVCGPENNYHLRNKPGYRDWTLWIRGAEVGRGKTLREAFSKFNIDNYKEDIQKSRQDYINFFDESLHWP